MASGTITTNTTTAVNVPSGEHLLQIWGTWDSGTLAVRHRSSALPFSGLSALTADPSNGFRIFTGDGAIDIVTTGGGGSMSLQYKIDEINTADL